MMRTAGTRVSLSTRSPARGSEKTGKKQGDLYKREDMDQLVLGGVLRHEQGPGILRYLEDAVEENSGDEEVDILRHRPEQGGNPPAYGIEDECSPPPAQLVRHGPADQGER